jgi:hypothetical protein
MLCNPFNMNKEFGSALELGGVIGAFGNEQMIFNEIRWRLTVGVQNSKTTSDSTTQGEKKKLSNGLEKSLKKTI